MSDAEADTDAQREAAYVYTIGAVHLQALEELIADCPGDLEIRQTRDGSALDVTVTLPFNELSPQIVDAARNMVDSWVAAYSLIRHVGVRIVGTRVYPVRHGSRVLEPAAHTLSGVQPQALFLLASRLVRSEKALIAARALAAARCEISCRAGLARLWEAVEVIFGEEDNAGALLDPEELAAVDQALRSILPGDKAAKVCTMMSEVGGTYSSERIAAGLSRHCSKSRSALQRLIHEIAQSRTRDSSGSGDTDNAQIYFAQLEDILQSTVRAECGLDSFHVCAWGDEYVRLCGDVAAELRHDFPHDRGWDSDQKAAVALAYGTHCAACGQKAELYEHHLVPVSEGGGHGPTVYLCARCHDATHGVSRTDLRTLTKAALARKKARGERIGREPYGFLPGSGQLRPDPNTFPIVKDILQMRGYGSTLQQISDKLNERGVKSHHGGKWYPSSVKIVLGNRHIYEEHLGTFDVAEHNPQERLNDL